MENFRLVFAAAAIASLAGAQPVKTRAPGRSHRIVQFLSDPSPSQLDELVSRGVSVVSYMPHFAFTVSAVDDTFFDGLDIESVVAVEAEEKISSALTTRLQSDEVVPALLEFYRDVSPNDIRAIALDTGLVILENPDLSANHLLVAGTAEDVRALAQWDEVAYIFPAADELIQGIPMHACSGALTPHGMVGQAVALLGDGWDGPGLGTANLQYKFVKLPASLPADAAAAEIVHAFSEWAKYAMLTFTPTSTSGAKNTLAVFFATGSHGDAYPFDGRGGSLAHTFYPYPANMEPIAGDMHFDDDELWRIGGDLDLFSLTLHETGHALGLGHSDNPGDVMYPYYRKVTALSQNDVAAIQQLYAARDTTELPASALTLVIQQPVNPTTALVAPLRGSTSGGSPSVQIAWTTNYGLAGLAQGSTSWTASVPLNIGSNVITVTARDGNQNLAFQGVSITRNSIPALHDTTSPSITILSPATTSYFTNSPSLVISGTARDDVGVAAVSWSSSNGGSGTAIGTTDWKTPAIPLYIGSTNITILASDAAGNTGWRSISVTRR